MHFVQSFAQLSKLAHLSITNAHSKPRCNKHPRTAGSRVARPTTQTSAKLIQADCFQCTHLCTSASSPTRIQRNISFECATSAISATSATPVQNAASTTVHGNICTSATCNLHLNNIPLCVFRAHYLEHSRNKQWLGSLYSIENKDEFGQM